MGQTPPSAPQIGSTTDQGTLPGNRQGPPQEALDACANEAQGATCSFNTPNGNIVNGMCIVPRDSSQLACAPGGMIPQNGHSPSGTAFGPDDPNRPSDATHFYFVTCE